MTGWPDSNEQRDVAAASSRRQVKAAAGSGHYDPFLDYHLPTHLIAQEPSPQRDAARLLVLSRATQTLAHHFFHELPDLLDKNDLLILNNTQVLPARLLGKRARTGGKWEGLFLSQLPDGTWEMMCQTRGSLLPGEGILVESCDASHALELTLIAKLPGGHWQVRPASSARPESILTQFGHVPLPPYIRKGKDRAEDRDRYQTVFAKRQGAVAAPTAGLHFTPQLLQRLHEKGVRHAFVTLHVGLGTFQPLQADDFTQHRMHSEWGDLPEATAVAVHAARSCGGRVIAVGTTSVRVLESASATGAVQPWSGFTDLYIRPPYAFRAVDALITNFHLPRTTLLLLVNAFAGPALIRKAYETAIAQSYRFFSYGDAMLIT